MQISIVENVLKLNDEIAGLNRERLRGAGVFTFNLIGAPGSGKTMLLEATLRRLKGRVRAAVCVGDLTTARDAHRLAHWCDQVVQVNTGKGCHLDANQVRQAMQRIDFRGVELFIIENVGNLICPVGFDLGQDVKVGMFSVSEGDDKAAKHPYLVQEAAVLLLNKTDLLPYVPFDLEQFRADVRGLKPRVPLIEVSAKNDDLAGWLDWVNQQVDATGRGAAERR
ncbi:MAG: hydrogenase nickel incorporation protein HypB [Phycisphaeraceae bacterium]|nr:hydrogenase nickel incorporation protein HypB [Phycisphaeraceae bacterium]